MLPQEPTEKNTIKLVAQKNSKVFGITNIQYFQNEKENDPFFLLDQLLFTSNVLIP